MLMHYLSDPLLIFFSALTWLNSATWSSHVIRAFDAQTCRPVSDVKLAHLVITVTTPKGFICQQLLTTHSNVSDATILMSAARESRDVDRIPIAWTLKDLTSARAREDSSGTQRLAACKRLECVQMGRSVIGTLPATTPEETDIGKHINHSRIASI